MSIQISDDDIVLAEDFLGFSFNQDQKNIIKNLEKVDIQAAPGSGKTTTLAAKLVLLAEKIPPGQGVLVLTHTNVAVNEIKAKIGPYTKEFFNFPNHLGTIQSFVNKYLAIPAFVDHVGRRPARIDDDTYYEVIGKRIEANPFYTKAQYALAKRNISIQELRFSCADFSLSRDLSGTLFPFRTETETFKNSDKCRKKILADGVLCFDDAYSLAFLHMRKHPVVLEHLRGRFKYIFIDEMQDMDQWQCQILSEIFEDSIIQRIGDKNQAIYRKFEESMWNARGALEIKKTVRLPDAISSRIENIAVNPQKLEGRKDGPQIPPHILVFNNESILRVREKFCELIIKHDLENSGAFRAIGLRKNHASERSIRSYFPEFSQAGSGFNFFGDYLNSSVYAGQSLDGRILAEHLYNGILKALRLANCKPTQNRVFTKTTLLSHLDEGGEQKAEKFLELIFRWCSKIAKGEVSQDEITQFILSELLPLGNGQVNADIQNYFAGNSGIEPWSSQAYKYRKNDREIIINISTIHSAKGETHAATLVLETYNRVYDLFRVLPFVNEKTPEKKRTTEAERLRTSYVAMTRAKNLLCLAVHQENIQKQKGLEDTLKDRGWIICEV